MLFQLADIHVARSPGAEENDVAQRGALLHQAGRHVGMVVDTDVVAVENTRQLAALEGRHIHRDWRIIRPDDPLPHRRELLVAVDEQRFHRATIGCAASAGSRIGTPAKIVPSSNQDFGAG